jgi:L-malate glycosyltransferase
MRAVTHITPHLGGGVGSVLLNYLDRVKGNPCFEHRVFSLEYANEKALLASKTAGFFLADRMSSDHKGLLDAIAASDIVIFHWWNHPLLNYFLVRETLPSARIIFWSHISGFHPPYIFNKPALYYPDLFVFTSPVSYETPEVMNLPDERKDRLRDIWSTGGVERFLSLAPKKHAGVNVGYVGTVDYGKIHPDFLNMCGNVSLPDIQFIVCGGPSQNQLLLESERMGMSDRFRFTGQVGDVSDFLPEFDIFGYPLAPHHYGTCEQSLGESMAAGVPPVVLANRTESCIVTDGVTGMVAQDEASYTRALETLCRDSGLRQRLSFNAREDAGRRYSLDLMIARWDKVFDEVLMFPKTGRTWTGNHSGQDVSPACVFLESLGDYAETFAARLRARSEREKDTAAEGIKRLCESSPLWRSETRGAPRHYHRFFPEDKDLKTWSALCEEKSI